MRILAHHIVWTTYGTWLPGDARGWICRGSAGIQQPNAQRQQRASRGLMQEPVELSEMQRQTVKNTIREHCKVRDWTVYALIVRSNHIHVVAMLDRDSWTAMKELKAWSSRRLSEMAGLSESVAQGAGRRRWFTEGGKCKTITSQTYLRNAVRYVLHGQ